MPPPRGILKISMGQGVPPHRPQLNTPWDIERRNTVEAHFLALNTIFLEKNPVPVPDHSCKYLRFNGEENDTRFELDSIPRKKGQEFVSSR